MNKALTPALSPHCARERGRGEGNKSFTPERGLLLKNYEVPLLLLHLNELSKELI
jgi:hypothetical protein